MKYTAAIAAIILGYTWIAAPLVSVRGPWLVLPVVLVLGLCAMHNRRTHDWGFSGQGVLAGAVVGNGGDRAAWGGALVGGPPDGSGATP